MIKWQPIETAPRERPILVLCETDWICATIEYPDHSTCPQVAYWHGKYGWCSWLGDCQIEPHWWCDLPQDPEVDHD